MSFPRYLYGSAVTGLLATALLSASASADIECWAPGMPATTTLTATTRYQSVSLGKPYRYDIFGVGGTLTLGDQANGAQLSGGVFKQKLLGLIPLGNTVDSTAFVELQTSLTRFYPEYLSVTGNKPGVSVGPVQKYGENWTLSDPKNPFSVNITFHQAGSTLLTALLPGLLSPAYYNINPTGTFFVLGEYHASPPVMTGTLTFPADSVMVGTQTTVNFTVDRNEKPVYRPPLLGLDLGSTNLTILGTPPVSSPASSGMAPVYAMNNDQVVATVNLSSGTSGNGWTRITLGL